jgi:endonuclease/exonuclease/phosphatase family metal-dependent hydrolase
MKLFNYVLNLVCIVILCFGIYCAGIIAYGSLTEYHFEDEQKLSQDIENLPFISDSTFELISWNVGFFGLGEESDFFYDGGEDVFQSTETVRKNMDGVLQLIEGHSNVDFFMLQEVDSFSWRSQKLNFFEELEGLQNSYEFNFALNYASNFVPIPFFNPSGPTFSGLYSMSRFPVEEAFRYDLRTESLWPKRLFFLKRCFLTQRIQLEEKELVVVNIHNSAYDKSGEKKNKEMQQLMTFAENEFAQGNYVIIGGDWNQCPPDYKPNDIPQAYKNSSFTNEDIPEGWQWVADVTTSTNRKLDKPYSRDKSYTSVIDHYLISPNVQVDSIAVINMDFAFSDHQPVYLKVTLK